MAEGQEGRAAFRYRSAELAIAAFFLVIGAVVVYDSVRLGRGWADDGPRPGYFPFYLGLIICISALVNAVRALMVPKEKNKGFVEVGQLKMVLTVLVPTAVYAFLIGGIGSFKLGIYLASALFIAFFMRWLGKYAWWKVATVSVGTVVVFYLIFEKWFLVPLPKGPLENMLGLG
jgi:putative tricarboxylic transport membrane protein